MKKITLNNFNINDAIIPLGFAFGLILTTLPTLADASNSAPIRQDYSTFYVDAKIGNDQNDGLSNQTPWKTIAKVNAQDFVPGDTILFKRGDVWFERLNIYNAGVADKPITFGAYDNVKESRSANKEVKKSADPVISAADIINPSLWVKEQTPASANSNNEAGAIYSATIGTLSNPNQLYVDNQFYDIARYPNQGLLSATGNSTDQRTVIDTNLTLPVPSVDLIGSTIITKSLPWTFDPAVVSNYNEDTKTITTSNDIRYVMTAGYGYYFRDKLWMLDAPNEWYYDKVAGKIYIWMPNGDAPSNHIIAVTARDYGIVGNHSNYVNIKDIKVVHAGMANVIISNSTGNVLNNVTTLGGSWGFKLGCTSCKLQNSRAEGAFGYGVESNGNNVTLAQNFVNNTGNVGYTPDLTPFAVVVNGEKSIVEKNTVLNSAYSAIVFNGSNHTIKNNRIDNLCLKLGDCSGIYSWALDPYNTQIGNTIDSNIISNAMQVTEGVPHPYDQGNGIYMDDRINHTTISNNTVYNTAIGIFIHNGHNHLIKDNNVYQSRVFGLAIQQDWVPAGYVVDNAVDRNYLHSLGSAMALFNYSESRLDFGKSKDNKLCTNSANKSVRAFIGNNSVNNHFTIDEWRASNLGSEDIGSVSLERSCEEEVEKFSEPFKSDVVRAQ